MTEKPLYNIILTGFMATGKSTVAKHLARTLNHQFIDTDSYIEDKYGLSIPEIFKQKGEEIFRKMETEAAGELAAKNSLVVATGGRLMLNPENVDLLTKNGVVFCLVATPEEILDRLLQDSENERPLLSVPDPKAKILELMEERRKGYLQFKTIETSNKKPSDIASEIMGYLHLP